VTSDAMKKNKELQEQFEGVDKKFEETKNSISERQKE
jgi:hypothetical protein